MKVILKEQEPAYINDPINLDRALQELQRAFKNNLPWLGLSFGRARVIPERSGDKVLNLPKVYYGSKEHLNILMHDITKSVSWFQLMGPEVPLDYAPGNLIQKYQAQVAAIFWMKLDEMKLTAEDYHHLEIPKRQAINLLTRYPTVTLLRVYDENARDIFREYTAEVDKDQFLTYPKAGLRLEFLITFNYACPSETGSASS